MRAVARALSFLTRLPGPTGPTEPPDLARAAGWFPAAGAVVGAAALGALTVGSWGWTPLVGAVAAVAAEAWITRGLHLDGLADCFDGLLYPGDPARRLEVMHDPRIGGLGAVAMALWVAARVAMVAATVEAGTALAALWLAAVLARAPLAAELRLPAATPGRGLFGWLGPAVTRGDAWTGLGVGLLLAGPALALHPVRAVVGLAAAALVTVGWHRLWRARIGGGNGDVLGAAVELRTMVFLTVLGAGPTG